MLLYFKDKLSIIIKNDYKIEVSLWELAMLNRNMTRIYT